MIRPAPRACSSASTSRSHAPVAGEHGPPAAPQPAWCRSLAEMPIIAGRRSRTRASRRSSRVGAAARAPGGRAVGGRSRQYDVLYATIARRMRPFMASFPFPLAAQLCCPFRQKASGIAAWSVGLPKMRYPVPGQRHRHASATVSEFCAPVSHASSACRTPSPHPGSWFPPSPAPPPSSPQPACLGRGPRGSGATDRKSVPRFGRASWRVRS